MICYHCKMVSFFISNLIVVYLFFLVGRDREKNRDLNRELHNKLRKQNNIIELSLDDYNMNLKKFWQWLYICGKKSKSCFI